MLTNRMLGNAKWIIGCKITQSLLQMVIGMLSARYLGPANYGLVNYAASVVAFFIPVMQLGLQATLVQECVGQPEKEGEILGTSLVMNLISALACMVGATTFALVANSGERTTVLVCALYSISLVAQSTEMFQYWFQAKLLSKYSSLATLCSYVIVSAYKIYLLASGQSVYWFALSYTVEYGVTGILLLITYRRVGTQRISFSLKIAKMMFARSKHYIMSTLMLVVYNRTGHIMLKLFLGESATGFYATAVTCTNISLFVFNAILDTARPVVLGSRQNSYEAFEKNMSRVYALTTWLSLAQSIFFTIFAKFVIKFLYGEAYLPAVPVLQIMIWNTVFSYMGSVRNIWILAEEKHKVLFTINFCGAIANLIINACLIPLWGAIGAAMASVFTQVFTNFIMGFILKPIRRNNYLLLKGLNPKLLLELVKQLKTKNEF